MRWEAGLGLGNVSLSTFNVFASPRFAFSESTALGNRFSLWETVLLKNTSPPPRPPWKRCPVNVSPEPSWTPTSSLLATASPVFSQSPQGCVVAPLISLSLDLRRCPDLSSLSTSHLRAPSRFVSHCNLFFFPRDDEEPSCYSGAPARISHLGNTLNFSVLPQEVIS